MTSPFIPAVEPANQEPGPVWWFAFQEDKLLVLHSDGEIRLPDLEQLELSPTRRHYLGALGGQGCYVVEIAGNVALPDNTSLEGLRGLFGRLDEDLFGVAGRALQIVTWDRTHQFCGRCGSPTELVPGERARKCPVCGLTAYPRISPAVIMQVTKGDQILLARGLNFAEGMYSTPAGFVEPGETLEEAVAREIEEETGVIVDNIRYFGSQPWPYPHQMMIGFTASWAAGEIQIDPNEIADAQWFNRRSMPHIPPRMSISRRLIDDYLEGGR
ncbi:MAG: diphosphatase [Chloroflexi bacterium]|nr:diphosphatase [Chloroflexota bacterium]